MTWRERVSGYIAATFGLDVRSLAAFRVALGGLLAADLSVRARDLTAMYCDPGIAPTALVRSLAGSGQWSLHLISGAFWYQAILFILAAALALAVLVGCYTRAAAVGSWVLLASLHVRQPAVLNAGDTLLRVLLFWAMFLPLGAAWSVDSRRKRPTSHCRVVSAASAGLVLQLAVVYWAAGLAKWNAAWLDGDALGQILSFQFYSKPWGHYLLGSPELTRWLSRGVVCLELAGPLLLFLPWKSSKLRMVLVAAFIAFHLGIAATVTVGMFPWVGIAAWLAIIPSEAWNRSQRVSATSNDLAQLTLHRSETAICCAAILLVTYWNIADLTAVRLPSAARALGNATALRQSWQVFSHPANFDARFVFAGRLKNGKTVDLVSGEMLVQEGATLGQPQQLPNHRWRKLLLRTTERAYAPYRQPLADYVVRHWNAEHRDGEQAVRLDFYCQRRRLEPGSTPGDYVRNNLARVELGDDGGAFAEALRELDE
jgi:hypothetical protein